VKVGDLVKLKHWSDDEPEYIGLFIKDLDAREEDWASIYEVMVGDKAMVFFKDNGWELEVISESR
jgi:hypothetical protein